MAVYLKDIPLSEAKDRFYQSLTDKGLRGILATEVIALNEKAVGRVLAESLWAKISSPHYHASAMDGFAVNATDTNGASVKNPIFLRVGEQAFYVDTGDPLPSWTNAVIPIEQVEPVDENESLSASERDPYFIRIREAKTPWNHVRPLGEDIIASELLLPAGKSLKPVDLGAAAASGHDSLIVSRKPTVAIIPTGTELIKVGDPISKGNIIEFNSIVLAGQINRWGGEGRRYPITEDNFKAICNRVMEAAESADLVLLNAGSSAGSEDFSAKVVEELGELIVHGIAVRPGHPVILGMIQNSSERYIPIIGVPGYPVSAALTGEIFVKPLIDEWLGLTSTSEDVVEAHLTKKITSPSGDDDYVRVVLGNVLGKDLAAPLNRGAGVITSLVRADGYTIIPRGIQGKEAGDKIKVHLLKNKSEIDRTIFVIGSHDMSLDILAEELSKLQTRMVSSNVGSLGGIIAVKRGEAHFAGTHLLDTDSGTYNTTYIKKYLGEKPYRLLSWVYRQQGFIVAKKNPKKIETLIDLARDDVRFINRQRGAGTRILLDYQLIQQDISPEEVNGYDQEEFTHLSIAAAVSSGRADVGMGIAAAAVALDLDFIPVFKERYDLLFPIETYSEQLIEPVFSIMSDKKFRQRVQALPGYDVSCMGDLMLE